MKSSKFQTPEKLQWPNFKRTFDPRELVFGTWSFFGVWSLVFGASPYDRSG